MNRFTFAALLLFFYIGVRAQFSATVDTIHPSLPSFTHFIDEIDVGYCTSGLWLEASPIGGDLSIYDGSSIDSTNVLDIDKYGMVYATLYGAVVDASHALAHPDQAYLDAYRSPTSGTAYLSALFYQ